MEIAQFALHNWYLFVALVVVLALLAAPTVTRLVHRVRSVGPAEAVMLINREDGVVVDVRDAKEYQAGHIVRAINLPMGELDARVRELDKYKKRPLILSCGAGERSAKVAIQLRKDGFENVAVLAGGLAAWERSQLPVAK
jgi:rhodanese-related sulfurtransferase